MILALAGRRIDAPDASVARFPAGNVPAVAQRLRSLFQAAPATAVVSSAACGADLIALHEAGCLRLRRRILLPFDRAAFRESSVTDRPGDWGSLFDLVIAEASATDDVVTLANQPLDDAAYAATNQAILDEAEALCRATREPLSAVLVWDGQSRGPGDLTAAFGDAARHRGVSVIEVQTLRTDPLR